jgi:hypothetical protein
MKRFRRKKNMRGLTLAFAVVVAAVAVPTVAAKPVAGYYSSQAYRALVLRSQGMDQRYVQQQKTTPASVSSFYSSPAYRALVIRSEAMNRRYGHEASAPVAASSSSSFDWTTFSIGASAFVAAIALIGGTVAVRRSQTRKFAV